MILVICVIIQLVFLVQGLTTLSIILRIVNGCFFFFPCLKVVSKNSLITYYSFHL